MQQRGDILLLTTRTTPAVLLLPHDGNGNVFRVMVLAPVTLFDKLLTSVSGRRWF
jgi:hypothetical protein